MPISATCTKCGKILKVKDEYIGKRMKCPQCSTVFTATPGGGGAMGAPSIAKHQSKISTPSFHMSPAVIIFIIAFVLIGGSILFWNLGPGKARADWRKLEPQAKQEITDVIDRGLESSQADDEDLGSGLGGGISIAHSTPHVMDMTFPFTLAMMSMPESMTFVGTSSKGYFRGKYNCKTGEIEADVDVNGVALPSGVVTRAGSKQVHMTGHSRDGKFESLVNGQAATVNFGDPSRHAK